MEILNNIWVAISTPNENFVSVMMMLATFVENYLLMTLYLTFLNIKATLKQKLIYGISIPIIGIIFMLLLPNLYYIILNNIVMILFAHYIFKISFLKSAISVLCSTFTLGILGSLISNPLLTILQISSTEMTTVPLYRFCYLLLMYILFNIIIIILKNKKIKISFIEDVDKKTKYAIIFSFLLAITVFIIQSIITFYYIDILPLYITFLNFITLLLYFALSLYSLTKVMKLTVTTKKLESAKEYNNTLRILHDNVRGFKHDFDNIVTTIGGYVRTNDIDGLKKYYVQLEDDCQRVNNLYILNPDVVNNDGIYNLLTKKYHESESKDIKVNISYLLDLSTLNMKIYEFGRILGILLDNAIEASSECEEKIINLTFRNDEKNKRQLIIVENTYSNKDVDTEKIFEKGISGKENHTGLGLWEVRKLVKKNKQTNLFTTKNEKYFTQQLEIYY